MSAPERNVRAGKEPVYQNSPFRKPPIPPPDGTHLSTRVVPNMLDETLPIWKIKGDERGRTISPANQNVVTHGQSNQSPCGTQERYLYDRSPRNVSCVKPEINTSIVPGGCCDHDFVLQDPVYEFAPPPRRNPINNHVPPVVITDADNDEVDKPPSIPTRAKQVMLSPDQTDLFHQVPPPSSRTRGGCSSSGGFSSSGSHDVPSFTSSSSTLGRSPSTQLQLTASVPSTLPRKFSKSSATSDGYVPPKPGLSPLPAQLNVNGYLKMNKEAAVDSRESKPPFDDLWNQDTNADDPEYFTMSDLYADEPLYQVYHRDAVVRDVLEQNMEDEDDDVEYEDYNTMLTLMLKRTSERRIGESFQLDVLTTVENLLPQGPGLRRYWSDTVQVKQSGVLDRLSSQEKKHQECIFEIITSEASYLKSLKLLQTHFMESPLFKPPESTIFSQLDYKHLFSNVEQIITVSNRVLQELEMIWKQNVILDAGKICRTLKTVAEEDYGVYIPYLTNAAYQERKLAEFNAKPEFRSMLTDLEDAPEVNGLKLQSFLVLPMQRITRVPLLVLAVQPGINFGDPAIDDTNECFAVFKKILKECNEKARQMENLEQLNELTRLLLFRKPLRTIPIVSQNRHLIKKGPLDHIRPTEKLPEAKAKRLLKNLQQKVLRDRCTKHFFLFNDLLLIAKKKNNHFEVIKSLAKRDFVVLPIDESNVETYLPGGTPHDCNFLFSLEVFDEDTRMVLACDSENERMRWIEACDPSSPQNEQDDAIYEINDCPQVQTIQRFVPSEPDELALEESDIVDVLRKTKDGWYEGQRIRDGRRGWFLANHTIEIENAHKRAKNRRQQWRLLKQTQTFQQQRLNLTV